MQTYIIYGAISAIIIYFLSKFIFDLLLRGFSPFIQSRPWVVDQISSHLKITQKNPNFLALSSGRSGFFNVLAKKYPTAKLTGVEPYFFSYLVAITQIFIRRSPIKIIHQAVHHVNYKEADLVYCHLEPDQMRDLGAKLKFECKPGALIVSTGFNIVGLKPSKVIDLPDRKGRLDWLSKNQKLFQAKHKKYKKEKKAYFYEI
ncbi:MAG: hypothetical protein US83_C0006G0029 [Candidatus Falkowbacteria bacterium GW2011_GWC2_38_22]|uniref:Uncharacterized protein n=1 Tax=Candidatus Falkowbacteria bacterium GW2011_GWE1_38_31 TaxID=1618638 RepID=A0A0G0JUF3_9BACT|nr:MAG: hypothetical protein US73_C0001G0060 [Candidatus Falkowbacteria bacterium GW2011_GWF2_38_1205]KKQ61389.1 MAG: hypothetical protein US83_C0006G0029 [Candidatus Falkowbacteria bacterium GW2011_GWC2_38_22]KKQ64028.1 MAG: hypothetical protein US84_C0002G0060 [Candidatus Falkowbacteria bacterium GW2011_GWF1_38_22]KKQ66624.1 MAG: hypothetical protein US87_C0001G0145 [Candidatus Falkowbacteria bacterium GW2011_GWE2_38_254]KKQ71133.1 MAG: hypothetical protein US91_C0001G0060 [Candidatus Falkowb